MKKLVCLLLCTALLLTLAACHVEINPGPSTETTAPTEPKDVLQLPGSGTELDPWRVGKNNEEDVTVYLLDEASWLIVSGQGEMRDFEEGDVLPWSDKMGEMEMAFWDSEIESVGAYAFRGLGADTEEGCSTFLPDELKTIGAGAFTGAKLYSARFGVNVETVGPAAFANTQANYVEFDGAPQFAPDAFAGVSYKGHLHTSAGWSHDNLPDCGITWLLDHTFSYVCEVDGMEFTGENYIPEGEEYRFDALVEVPAEGYQFQRYEVLEGDLTIADPTNPLLVVKPTGDIAIRIIMEPEAN